MTRVRTVVLCYRGPYLRGMDIRRWTPLTMLVPGRFVDRDAFWSTFDLETWAGESYEWVEDPWNGYLDLAKRPRRTVAEGRGDCEDFALVSVAWAVARGRSGVGLAFCWECPYPWPRHVLAYDDERVYSSGEIRETTVEDWVAGSRYAFSIRRPIG